MAKRVQQSVKRRPDGNPRYSHVNAVVDSGASVTRYLRTLDKFRRDFKVKRDEIFKRIKVEVFVSLVVELNEFVCDEETPSPNSDGCESTDNLSADDEPCSTARSSLQSVINGIGEMDVSGKPQLVKLAGAEANVPYLLLDVRDRESYEKCHIISSISYPAMRLTRSINYETPELLQFKNKPEKIVVLYDDDELVAPGAATTFAQRGYDNIYMLSGGLKVAWKLFPVGLIAGCPSPSWPQAAKSEQSKDGVELSNRFSQHHVGLLRQQLDQLRDFPSSGVSTARSWTSSSAQSVRSASTPSVASKSARQRTPWK